MRAPAAPRYSPKVTAHSPPRRLPNVDFCKFLMRRNRLQFAYVHGNMASLASPRVEIETLSRPQGRGVGRVP